MTTTTYQVTDYLLDRANIHDTVTRFALTIDLHDWTQLATDVLADQVIIDYTSMFGGEPQRVTPSELAAQWKPLVEGMDATQHVYT
ncbi:hypothetical protein VTN96DRAFT_2296 [Rasamsonia emersonii]